MFTIAVKGFYVRFILVLLSNFIRKFLIIDCLEEGILRSVDRKDYDLVC